MVGVRLEAVGGGFAQDLAEKGLAETGVVLWWLGQAGFAVRSGGFLCMIDPYLSDLLAEKYGGTKKPHERMMPPPIALEDARGLSAVLCSHAHSDHMDPDGLGILAENNPDCAFVVPAAAVDVGVKRGLPRGKIRAANAGDVIALGEGVTCHVVPAAHEEIKTDEEGRHHFIGFILELGGVTIYHSGDCVPFDGLEETLRSFAIDAALLPVNGRDERRRGMNIVGNFEFEEAAELCRRREIPVMIPHHFGMFALNTVPAAELERKIDNLGGVLRCVLPDVEHRIVLRKA